MKILLAGIVATSLVALAAPAVADPGPERALAIVAPSAQQTLLDEGGSVVISLAPSPGLGEGDRIVVLLDDEQIVVMPAGMTKFVLMGVPGGSHDIEAIIVDAEGNPLAAAESVTFTMSELVKA
jgi:hypothetical protein